MSGEESAVLSMVADGYEILGRNVRFGHYEIDFIARNERRLAFVEVKTRRMYPANRQFQKRPLEEVDARKRACLLAAAQSYLREHRAELGSRTVAIDIAEVYVAPASEIYHVLEIRKFENAVHPDDLTEEYRRFPNSVYKEK